MTLKQLREKLAAARARVAKLLSQDSRTETEQTELQTLAGDINDYLAQEPALVAQEAAAASEALAERKAGDIRKMADDVVAAGKKVADSKTGEDAVKAADKVRKDADAVRLQAAGVSGTEDAVRDAEKAAQDARQVAQDKVKSDKDSQGTELAGKLKDIRTAANAVVDAGKKVADSKTGEDAVKAANAVRKSADAVKAQASGIDHADAHSAVQDAEKAATDARKAADDKVAAEADKSVSAVEKNDGNQGLPAHHTMTDGANVAARRLAADCSIGRFLLETVNGAIMDGPELELRSAYGLGPRQLPMAMLLDPASLRVTAQNGGRVQLSSRSRTGRQYLADAITAGPSSESVQVVMPIIGQVFADTDIDFLGVLMRERMAGRGIQNVITGGPTVDVADEGDSKEASRITFDQFVLSPLRVATAIVYDNIDRLLIPNFEADIRAHVRRAYTDRVNNLIIRGSTTPSFGGLLSSIPTPSAPNNVVNQAAAVKDYQFNDGLYARNNDDLRALVHPKAYEKYAEMVFSNTSVTVAEKLADLLGGFRSSAHLPDVASNISQNLVALMGAMDGSPNVCLEHWSNASRVIFDETTYANNDRIKITFIDYYQAAVFRSSGFKRVAHKLA